jgi:hypothetical protein
LQVWPLVVQSRQLPPKLPHVVLLDLMQVPPWQQPVRQLRKLQLPPPDEPDELPDEPEEPPLADPPDELLIAAAHDPLWQVWPIDVQSLHVEPWIPQAESKVPLLQLPFMSQHPMHVGAQALAALPVSALEPDPSSPDAVPLSSLPVGVFSPGPVFVGAGGAASTTTPASGTWAAAKTTELSTLLVPVPPVAQATRATRTNQPNPLALGCDEPMRRPPALPVTRA